MGVVGLGIGTRTLVRELVASHPSFPTGIAASTVVRYCWVEHDAFGPGRAGLWCVRHVRSAILYLEHQLLPV